jgi:hypothetical protein
MTVTSPLEDLYRSTLRAITGALRKLEYLAGLREPGGKNYVHWGFARVYGEIPASRTLQQAHRQTLSEVLSTPLEKLAGDAATSSSGGTDSSVQIYLEQLGGKKKGLLPLDPPPGAERHLNSVLHALSALEKNRTQDATPPAS